jgi:polyhydroxybutyrate depolymerase
MTLDGRFDYDDSVTLLRPSRIARSLFLLAPLSLTVHAGCSDAATDGPDGPRFTPNGAAGSAPVSNTPGAPPPATNEPPAATPGPTPAGSEQTPAPGGIDNGGAAAPGMVGAPDPNTAAPPADETPAPAAGVASAGCGLASGTPMSPDDQRVDSIILTFPPTYDGSTPVPLVFGFHGAGRTNLEQRTVDSRTVGSELEQNYVVAFMKSAGNAWDLGTDYPRFQAVRQQILSQLCIDTEHVFAFGHSSGAQFIVQMLGDNRARETGFAAIAPVSSSRYGNPEWTPVPTLLIHGLNDTARPGDNDGAQDIAQYAESNQCAGGTSALAVPSCGSLAGGVAVNPGCVQYDGCAAPTLFCNHDDPNYIDNGNPTNHGWPCFANGEIFRFFEAQR